MSQILLNNPLYTQRKSHVMCFSSKMDRMAVVRKIHLPDELTEIINSYLFCCEICLPDRGFCERFRYCKVNNNPVWDGVNSNSPLNKNSKLPKSPSLNKVPSLSNLNVVIEE